MTRHADNASTLKEVKNDTITPPFGGGTWFVDINADSIKVGDIGKYLGYVTNAAKNVYWFTNYKQYKAVCGLDDILTSSVNGGGYNAKYGLLGSNKSTEEKLKLFPKTGQELVEKIQKMLKKETGKTIEVMVYGDGAFKDPIGKIWELADPVVSPAYTSGLVGTPNELKLKYISDNALKDLSGEELKEAMIKMIKEKDSNTVNA